jgi:hypothetical protein
VKAITISPHVDVNRIDEWCGKDCSLETSISEAYRKGFERALKEGAITIPGSVYQNDKKGDK